MTPNLLLKYSQSPTFCWRYWSGWRGGTSGGACGLNWCPVFVGSRGGVAVENDVLQRSMSRHWLLIFCEPKSRPPHAIVIKTCWAESLGKSARFARCCLGNLAHRENVRLRREQTVDCPVRVKILVQVQRFAQFGDAACGAACIILSDGRAVNDVGLV